MGDEGITFLDFIRKVHKEKKASGFVIKGGKSSGWFAPPKGTHGKGEKGKAKGFEGHASFAGHKPHGKRGKKPLGIAHHKGDITFDRVQYSALGNEARYFSIAHEVTHQTVEKYVLRNQKEWDRAEKLLTIATVKGGRRLLIGGNLRIGEAVSDAVAGAMTDSKFGGISDEKWNDIKRWAKEATGKAGYDWDTLKADVRHLQKELDSQL